MRSITAKERATPMANCIDRGTLRALGNIGQIPSIVIPGPGPTAEKELPGTDTFTFLISPGVLDCAILTVYYPRLAPPTPIDIGGHRRIPGSWTNIGWRWMAHYNPFSGPKPETFQACLAGLTARVDPRTATVSVSYNALAKGPYYKRLIAIIEEVAPLIQTVNLHSFAGTPGTVKGTPRISIYMAPNGDLFGSSP